MDQKIKFAMMLAACVLISVSLAAQPAVTRKEKSRARMPAWVSDKGYWVVESNIHQPGYHTVFFYDNENSLMYKETLQGVKLNTEKRSVKMKLKKALETSAATWHRTIDDQVAGIADRTIVRAALQ